MDCASAFACLNCASAAACQIVQEGAVGEGRGGVVIGDRASLVVSPVVLEGAVGEGWGGVGVVDRASLVVSSIVLEGAVEEGGGAVVVVEAAATREAAGSIAAGDDESIENRSLICAGAGEDVIGVVGSVGEVGAVVPIEIAGEDGGMGGGIAVATA